MYDPYGYYKARNLYSLDKDPNVPFYQDFPENENNWRIGPNFSQIGKLYIPDKGLDNQLPFTYDLTHVETHESPVLTTNHPTNKPEDDHH